MTRPTPRIDFSRARPTGPDAERQAADARARLRATDWYVLRLTETGEPIPADVAAARSAARAALSGPDHPGQGPRGAP